MMNISIESFELLHKKNTNLFINNSSISLLFSPVTFIVTFAGALRQALAYLVHSCHVAVGAMVTKSHNLHAFLNIAV